MQEGGRADSTQTINSLCRDLRAARLVRRGPVPWCAREAEDASYPVCSHSGLSPTEPFAWTHTGDYSSYPGGSSTHAKDKHNKLRGL